MAIPIPFGVYVMYGASGANNYSLVGNVQSISVNNGRTWATDPYSPATCTIVLRGVATFGIGQQIMVLNNNSASNLTGDVVFMGTVKDTYVDYGLVSNMNYTTVTLESMLARWGRRQFTSRAIAQATTLNQISTLATAISYNTFTSTSGAGQSIASAQTYVGNGLDLINQLIQTEMGHIADAGGYYTVSGTYEAYMNPIFTCLRRNWDATANVTFADDSTASGVRYSDIKFSSATQNYYTEATINPQGLASQTAGSGYYNITQDSLDYSTSQALSHAQYLVSQYNTTTATPISITASYALQNTATRQNVFKQVLSPSWSASGNLINIKFNGTTYACIIEGTQITSDPAQCEITLTLSSFDNNNYLILNNATFGTLGTSVTYPGNKLGF